MYMMIKMYDTLSGNRQNQIEMVDETLNTRHTILCKTLHCRDIRRDSNYEQVWPSPLTSLSLTPPSSETPALTALPSSESCCEIK